jgi:chemotaxis protein methyltransferase CheR
VVCKNVLIYFQKDVCETVLSALYSALNPGGFLILGMTESVSPRMRDLLDVVNVRERVFRKPSAMSRIP